MARNNLQVEVTEATTNEVRTITITITGAAEEFQLADLLAQRKAIASCSSSLKTATLEATKAYLESAEEVISGVKAEQKKESDDADNSSRKRARKSKESASENEVLSAQMTTKPVNGSIPATGLSRD